MPDHGAEALDRFWDDLAAGGDPVPDGFDSSMADAVRALHAAPDVEHAGPEFMSNLWEDLMFTSAQSIPVVTPRRPAALPGMNGIAGGAVVPTAGARGPAVSRAPMRSGHLRWLGVAAVALLLLGIAATVWLRGPGDSDQETRVVPAANVQATPSSAVEGQEVLASVLLPIDPALTDTASTIVVASFALPAGSRTTWDGKEGAANPGYKVDHILSESVQFRSDGHASVIRAGTSEPETVEPGTDITLEAGDTLIHRNEFTDEWTVGGQAGDAPTTIVSGFILSGSPMSPAFPDEWEAFESDFADRRVLPAGPYRLELLRVTLAPDEILTPPAGTIGQMAAAAPGQPTRLGRQGDDSVRNFNQETTTVFVMRLSSTVDPSGSPEAPDEASPAAVRPQLSIPVDALR